MDEKMELGTELVGGLNSENVVAKSRPLSLMRCVPFSLEELKVLDVYLSRINSHDPKRRTVAFSKAEYEEIMGIEKTNLATLKKYTKGLLGKVVEITMPEGYVQFVLFTRAEVKNDEYGVPTVYLTCTDEARQLFFNIERLGYLRYEVGNALALSHKSSYLLYLEVLRERHRTRWIVSVNKLRDKIFDLKQQGSYKEFKIFKRAILDPSVREINEKTDVKVSYQTIKHGRTVTDIVFIYEGKDVKNSIPEPKGTQALPLHTEETEAQDTEESDKTTADSCANDRDWVAIYGSERLAKLAEACDYEFGRVDMEAIAACLPSTLSDDTAAFEYLHMLYARMCAYARKHAILSRSGYLQAMARKEPVKTRDEPKKGSKTGSKRPMTQREIDMMNDCLSFVNRFDVDDL